MRARALFWGRFNCRKEALVSCCCLFLFPAILLVGQDASRCFINPVAPKGHDPWVILEGETYYYCYSDRNRIWINASDDLTEAVQFAGKTVWQPAQGMPFSRQLWAPELHRIQDRWYIYVAASDGKNENHRMYVLESDSPDGPFKLSGKIAAIPDRWAIDGTILQRRGRLYFIWSGWEQDINDAQHLYIAAMDGPAGPVGERVRISSPHYEWEKQRGRPRKDGSLMPLINEGPQVLQKNGRTFIIYSASGSWTDHYCLGMLVLVGDEPLEPGSWQKHEHPVFESTSEVTAPGHASFTTSFDLRRDWIIYHAARHPGAGWDRQTHLQPFSWDNRGYPVFGKPVSPGEILCKPNQIKY